MLKTLLRKMVDFVRRQQKSFKVNIAKNIVQNFSLGLTQQYQSIYISELGAGPIEIGYVTSLGGLASALITVPVGFLADRYGIRIILLTALPFMVLGYAIFGVAVSWQITALALIISTLTWQMVMTVCPMICGSTLNSVERVTGMQLCDTLSAVPRLVAPIVAACLITAFGGMNVKGIRPLYWIEVCGLLIAFLIVYKYFTNPRVREGSNPRQFISGIRGVLEEGVMAKRWIVVSMMSSLPMYMAIYIPLYASELKGANQFTIGLMDAAYWLVIVMLAIPIGLCADRFGRKKLIILMTPIYCSSMLLLIYAPNDLVLIIAGLLSGFTMLMGVTQAAISVELVPMDLLGNWFGILGLFRGIMNILSPILGGFIWKSLGPSYVFYFLIVSQLIKLPILVTIPTATKKS